MNHDEAICSKKKPGPCPNEQEGFGSGRVGSVCPRVRGFSLSGGLQALPSHLADPQAGI